MGRRKEEKREERDAENRKIKGRRKERGTGETKYAQGPARA